MPTLDLDENNATYQIRWYKAGAIQINETIFHHSLIIAPHHLIEPWEITSAQKINAAALTPILSLKPDILLIGTGPSLIFLPVETYGHLFNKGIGIEIMNTSAAARTYHALSAENRNVIAALII